MSKENTLTWRCNILVMLSPKQVFYLKEIGQEVLLESIGFLRRKVLLLQFFGTVHRVEQSKQFLSEN